MAGALESLFAQQSDPLTDALNADPQTPVQQLLSTPRDTAAKASKTNWRQQLHDEAVRIMTDNNISDSHARAVASTLVGKNGAGMGGWWT